MPPKRQSSGRVLLGAHTSTAGGVHHALEEGRALGCDVVQLFTRNQRQWTPKPLDSGDVDLWRARLAQGGVRPAMAHTSYLVNLCASDDTILEKSRLAILDEVDRADLLGIPNVVLHPGAHLGRGEEAGVAAICQSLNWIIARRPAMKTVICLETTAGQGTTLGWRFEQLAAMLAGVKERARVAVCIDTCHLFAAGYDIRTAAGWRATLEEFDKVIGLDALRCAHLNDSKHELGSRKDRHQHIGDGFLGLGAFAALLADPRLRDIPLVLETPVDEAGDAPGPGGVAKGYAENLAVLRSLLPKASAPRGR
ncbi:MAG: deoxyribonuclease IV [Planctomycetes bacterium]|nr:deoxyribonuclease IV [Planctomycetota bacterium]